MAQKWWWLTKLSTTMLSTCCLVPWGGEGVMQEFTLLSSLKSHQMAPAPSHCHSHPLLAPSLCLSLAFDVQEWKSSWEKLLHWRLWWEVLGNYQKCAGQRKERYQVTCGHSPLALWRSPVTQTSILRTPQVSQRSLSAPCPFFLWELTFL